MSIESAIPTCLKGFLGTGTVALAIIIIKAKFKMAYPKECSWSILCDCFNFGTVAWYAEYPRCQN